MLGKDFKQASADKLETMRFAEISAKSYEDLASLLIDALFHTRHNSIFLYLQQANSRKILRHKYPSNYASGHAIKDEFKRVCPMRTGVYILRLKRMHPE